MDTEQIRQQLAAGIRNADSVRDIEMWLRSQPWIESVEASEHLLKSNPPRREFIVEFTGEDRAAGKCVLRFFDFGDGRFEFHELSAVSA